MKKIFVVFVSLFLTNAAYADALLDAVSFATTGEDSSDVVALDRGSCIFNVRDKTFYLNNVHTNRIRFKHITPRVGGALTHVEIHGKQKVVDIFENGIPYDGSALHQELMKVKPNAFKQSSLSDYAMLITTNEPERLVAAWQFIYSNGCAGQKSAF